jgi:hypothetical protein
VNWLRLWHDMPNDPKWRSIARVSGRPVSEVTSVFVHVLVCASSSEERGRLEGWNDEDVAAALDMEPASVQAIREAMQGRVLEGNLLTSWEKRQRNREDDSAKRTKEWRDRRRTVTQSDAPDKRRIEEIREEEIREEKSEAPNPSPKNGSGSVHGSRFNLEALPEAWAVFAATLGWDTDRIERTFISFADYWRSTPGAKGRKADWEATWRNWCRRNDESPPVRNGTPFPKKKNFVESVTSVIQERAARGEKLL